MQKVGLCLANDDLLWGDVDHGKVLGENNRAIVEFAHILEEWVDGFIILEIVVGHAQFRPGDIEEPA